RRSAHRVLADGGERPAARVRRVLVRPDPPPAQGRGGGADGADRGRLPHLLDRSGDPTRLMRRVSSPPPPPAAAVSLHRPATSHFPNIFTGQGRCVGSVRPGWLCVGMAYRSSW